MAEEAADAAVRLLQDLDIEIYASFIVRPEFDRRDFAWLPEDSVRARQPTA